MTVSNQTPVSDPSAQDPNTPRKDRKWPTIGGISIILCLAAALRFVNLGQLSFWYDEVVTVRLARAGSPSELINLLFKIDATRAPLHPLLLEPWIALFGHSEFAARSLSAIFGLFTVLVIFDLGRKLFDASTGLCAGWLAVFSPLLVFYSREARMYSWLVLLACLAWRQLLVLRDRRSKADRALYVLIAAAMVYSHPLGLIMLATLALAGWLWRRSLFGGTRSWLLTHLAISALILPWCRYYLDHAPEFLSGPLPFKFLVGTPIAFIGGNFIVLGLVTLLVLFGMNRWIRSPQANLNTAASNHWQAFSCLLLWLIVPPTALYVYSREFQPIFGPARYSVYVAPAFLLLIGAGLSRLRPWLRLPAAAALTTIAVRSLLPTVYAPDIKADWRAFAESVNAGNGTGPIWPTAVIVAATDPARNVEVETARYYMSPEVLTLPLTSETAEHPALRRISHLFFAVGTDDVQGQRQVALQRFGRFQFRDYVQYPGLRVYEASR